MKRFRLLFPAVAVIALLFVAELALGSAGIGWRASLHALLPGAPKDAGWFIVRDLRLPRAILAALVGAILAVSGALLQTATRNALADPFLFGLSSGAAAGAVAVITHGGERFGVWSLPAAALAGALLSAVCVLALVSATRRRGGGAERLVIGGLAVSFLFSALTDVLLFTGDQRAAQSVPFWSLGGFGGARWSTLPLALFGTITILAVGLWQKRGLDALLAGDDTASSVGVRVDRLRMLVFATAAIGTACSVALCGVIGFAGLMVPHLCRALVGIRHGALVPASALGGAALMLGADLCSRIVLPGQDMPVGIIVSALGAAFVLALLLRRA